MNRRLSALEQTALGVIFKRGPCNAHAVIREFAGSQTMAYRSGAGSIYPLLKRLSAAGFVSCSGRKYAITEAGAAALRAWMLPPFEPSDFSTNIDGIRSRAYFLKLLSPSERQQFVDQAIVAQEGLLESCRQTFRDYQESGDRFSALAMLGAVRETEARLGWLHELSEEIRAIAAESSNNWG